MSEYDASFYIQKQVDFLCFLDLSAWVSTVLCSISRNKLIISFLSKLRMIFCFISEMIYFVCHALPGEVPDLIDKTKNQVMQIALHFRYQTIHILVLSYQVYDFITITYH